MLFLKNLMFQALLIFVFIYDYTYMELQNVISNRMGENEKNEMYLLFSINHTSALLVRLVDYKMTYITSSRKSK